MKTIGIVAEYNPFHSGHAWHIQESRRLAGEDAAVIVVMSGNWVQRGECALSDKWTRSEMALHGGADLVLELPTVWAAASAEGFARGATALMGATGIVDTLSFGSELGEVPPLLELAQCLSSPEFSGALRQEPPKNPFAQRRRQAAERLLGPEAAALLDAPNNNLGVEYLRFLPEGMEVVTVPRRGPAHDGERAGEFASASLLRRWIRAGEAEKASSFLPLPWKGEAADLKYCERALIARLRSMTPEEAEELPDSGDGLAARLLSAARQTADLEELYALTKTRTYAHARVRRLALYALLGLRGRDIPAAPPYIRVLGFNERGQALLKRMNETSALPVLVKPAHIRRCSSEAQALFDLESRFTDLYSLCFPTPRPCGLEWTTGPRRTYEENET